METPFLRFAGSDCLKAAALTGGEAWEFRQPKPEMPTFPKHLKQAVPCEDIILK
jgi:hypothetical protein